MFLWVILRMKKRQKRALDNKNWLHTGMSGILMKMVFFLLQIEKKISLLQQVENVVPQMIEGKINQIQILGHSVVIDKQENSSQLL